MRPLLLGAIAAAALVAGCVGTPADSGRSDVQQDVDARLGGSTPLEVDTTPKDWGRIIDDGLLDPDEAVRLAVANNSKLRSILQDLDIARAELWKASLPPNPVLDAELQFAESGGGNIIELTIAQSIIDILLIPRRRQVASERFEQVKAEVTAAVLDLATEVRATYRRLQAQVQLVELYSSATDATFLSFDAARRLREAGNIIELDVLREQALYEDTKVSYVDAQVAALQYREQLNTLMGVWGPEGSQWNVGARMPIPEGLELDSTQIESSVLEASLDLRALRHAIMALGHSVGLERLEVTFPEGALGLKGDKDQSGNWAVGPVATLSVPVFNFGQAAGAEAQARLRRAYEEYTYLAVRLRHSARSAYVQSEASGNNTRYLFDVVVPLRAQITRETQMQFNAMQIGIFQLLEAKRSELEAGRRYVEALRDHWLARGRLESLLLGRLPQERFGIEMPSEETSMATANRERSGAHQ